MTKAQTKTSSTQTKNVPDILPISIDKLPGIGPTAAKNPKKVGYGTVEALASVPIAEFMVDEWGIQDIPGKRETKSL
jgi:hypothetical protein